MPAPIKTIRQVRSLVRQNPGVAAKRIVSIKKKKKAIQSALNGLRQSNLNLRNIDKDIANTYMAYGPEPPFDPSSAFNRNYALLTRNERFANWKDRFAPIPQQMVHIPKTVNSDTFFGKPFMRVGTPVYHSYMDRMGYYPSPQPLAKPIKAPDPKAKSWSLPLSEIEFLDLPRTSYTLIPKEPLPFKKGGKIHIKKENRGKFTDYCGGKVTSECIARGKASPNPAIRKRATFAANARKWKH